MLLNWLSSWHINLGLNRLDGRNWRNDLLGNECSDSNLVLDFVHDRLMWMFDGF
jgi:hypothetical protein